jgi:hypothetical protein
MIVFQMRTFLVNRIIFYNIQEHVIVESKQPTMKKSVKRKAKSKLTMKKTRKTKVAVEEEKDDTKCANCDRLYNENEDWIQCDL